MAHALWNYTNPPKNKQRSTYHTTIARDYKTLKHIKRSFYPVAIACGRDYRADLLDPAVSSRRWLLIISVI